MKRRDFIAALGGAITWPLPSRAQPSRVPVVGFVNAAFRRGYAHPLSSFLKGSDDSGFVEIRNITIESQWAEGDYGRLPNLISDLINRNVDVIAATSTPAALAATAANPAIPVVFTASGDPIRLGLVPGLDSPGNKITGVTQLNEEVAPKRLELIHQLLPTAAIVGLLVNLTNPLAAKPTKELTSTASTFGVHLQVASASTELELTRAFDALVDANVWSPARQDERDTKNSSNSGG